jgi:uncharacterized protein
MSDEAPAPGRGWYADPFKRYRYRFWDGARWTGYAADGDVVWDDPEPANAAIADVEVAPVKRGLVTAFVGYFGGLGAAIAMDRVLAANDDPGGHVVGLLVSQACLWAGLVGACVVVARRRGTGSLRHDFDWRFRKIDIGLGIAGAIAGRVVGVLVVLPLPLPFDKPRAPDTDVFERVADGPLTWVVLIAIVCIGAPLIEELFFRGLMQPRLVEILGPVAGLPVTAVLFGAAHLTNWQGSVTFIYATSIAGGGLVLGLMRHVTGRLGPSTWAHFWFNAQAVAVTALLV